MNQGECFSFVWTVTNGTKVPQRWVAYAVSAKPLHEVFKPEADGRDKIVISVVDSGVGISKSDKVKLFKLFGCLS